MWEAPFRKKLKKKNKQKQREVIAQRTLLFTYNFYVKKKLVFPGLEGKEPFYMWSKNQNSSLVAIIQ